MSPEPSPEPRQRATPADRPAEESLAQRALNLLVYAPTGLVVAAIEELPELIAKGRERLDPQVRSAHAVGRMTMAFGRKEVERKASQLLQTSASRPPPRRFEQAAPRRSPSPAPAPPTPGPPSQAGPEPGQHGGTPSATAAAGSRSTVDLAIPGYDTLSASQVVRRLDGLSASELEAIRRYEESSRGRRTILHRVRQIREDHEASGSSETSTS